MKFTFEICMGTLIHNICMDLLVIIACIFFHAECLPSFKGPMPVLKPCMTSQAQEQAQLCLSTTENARAVLEQCPSRDHNHDNRVAADDCMCCHCNAELIKLQVSVDGDD